MGGLVCSRASSHMAISFHHRFSTRLEKRSLVTKCKSHADKLVCFAGLLLVARARLFVHVMTIKELERSTQHTLFNVWKALGDNPIAAEELHAFVLEEESRKWMRNVLFYLIAQASFCSFSTMLVTLPTLSGPSTVLG